MYKMMIVDDEYYTIVGLKSFINWSEYNIEIVATACDGEEGLKKALEIKPDIIITDIRMNSLDGLSMIEEIRKGGLDCEFLVMSGYKVFEYAQKAMSEGVFHYLLKPLMEEKLIFAVIDVCQRLNKKQIEKNSKILHADGSIENQDKILDKSSVIDNIIAYINENYTKDISLQKISADFFIEPSYLSRIFKKKTGMNFLDYITKKRINRAKELLDITNLTVYEIAKEVSYEDQKYFSNLFKRIEGISPSEYRKRL